MTRGFLTQIGSSNSGQMVNRLVKDSVTIIHDVLLASARRGLDVAMLCGSLRKPLRDEFYHSVTGRSFAESVREVLDAGGRVQILIWNYGRRGLISPETRALIEHACAQSAAVGGARLDIRLSGTDAGSENVCHFVLGYPAAGGPDWYLRIEEPHRPPADLDEPVDEQSLSIPAAILWGETAAAEGRRVLDTFGPLFDAAGKTGRAVPSSALTS